VAGKIFPFVNFSVLLMRLCRRECGKSPTRWEANFLFSSPHHLGFQAQPSEINAAGGSAQHFRSSGCKAAHGKFRAYNNLVARNVQYNKFVADSCCNRKNMTDLSFFVENEKWSVFLAGRALGRIFFDNLLPSSIVSMLLESSDFQD
jgi:hypothetical protein